MNDQPRTLGGRYELGKVIGRGGMAQVRLARDTRLGREVAVKELRVDLASDPTFQARFRREAQAAAGLNHPNIVSVYDTGEEMDVHSSTLVPYIVMELVHGRTLRDVLREGRAILPRRALEFTQGVLDALAFSHKAGIVHRDIKPANVLLTSSGLVKVMDFGIARAVSDTSATMTQTAAVIGTAQYLSPEQARGETVDARSDIYSAGCLLYELLVGRPPFQGDSPVSVAYQHVREAPVPPSHLDAEVTPAMDAIVLKALAKDPADRYANAGAMRDDITRLLTGQSVTATIPVAPPPPPAPAPVTPSLAAAATQTMLATDPATMGGQPTGGFAPIQPEPRRGRGWIWALVVAALVLLIAAGAMLTLTNQQPKKDLVDVPSVYGLNQTVAEKALTDARLVPVVEPVAGSNDATVGTVTAQNPIPAQKVAAGSQVKITVNVGPKKLAIPPALVGKTRDEVSKALTAAGFANVRFVEATDEPADAKANTVLSLSHPEGSTLAADTLIQVSYATGKARVPYLTGMTEAQARAEAAKYGFTNVKVSQQESAMPAGTVVATRPSPTALVPKSDPLELVIAKPADKPTSQPTSAAPETPGATPSP